MSDQRLLLLKNFTLKFNKLDFILKLYPLEKWFLNDISCRQTAINLCKLSEFKGKRKRHAKKNTAERIQINSNLRNFWHKYFLAPFVHFSPLPKWQKTEAMKSEKKISYIFLRVIYVFVATFLALVIFYVEHFLDWDACKREKKKQQHWLLTHSIRHLVFVNWRKCQCCQGT